MGLNKMSKGDWAKLRDRAVYFGGSLGLDCKVPKVSDVVDGIYVLYASYPDKLESAIDNEECEFINFGDDRVGGLKRKKELEQKGHHTYLLEAKGDATGRMIPEYYNNPARFVEVLFHEGFHNNSYNRMHHLIEEPGACFMGIEGAISFFNLFGSDEFISGVRSRRRSFNAAADRFGIRYQRRLAELSAGKVIPASAEHNNAVMLSDRADYLYYPLIRRVHGKIGYLGETRAILTGLPSGLDKGVKELECLVA